MKGREEVWGHFAGSGHFFKQKTAYEMLRSLVGSEMCIRDSSRVDVVRAASATVATEATVNVNSTTGPGGIDS